MAKASQFSLPADAKVVDFGDRYIIPGLIDTHGHLYARLHLKSLRWVKTDARLPIFYLAAGVTAIGDPGSMDGTADIDLRNRIDSGQLPGPRYFLAGEYIDMPPLMVRWMKGVQTPEEARAKVDQWAALGATAIKIYAGRTGRCFGRRSMKPMNIRCASGPM